jgi:DNA adenine methylase
MPASWHRSLLDGIMPDALLDAEMKAPFPYFGGKAPVANFVWAALGSPKHYIEPFFGSGAVLLARPNYAASETVESVCDKDGFLANVWRAMQAAPEEVARWCDHPVNHADLNARRRVLLKNESNLMENLVADDQWCDPKMAGYWIWAASCWIGSGLTCPNAIPHISHGGMGVHAMGQIPHISKGGMDATTAADVSAPFNTNIYKHFRQLSERLRYVRVVCGDWTRVCGGDWQDNVGDVGIFMDPPYGITDRNTKIYHHDSTDVATDVMAWCLERGSRPSHRIVLAGYDEHTELLSNGWTSLNWKACGGYANISNGNGKQNRKREMLYFSPHCLNTGEITRKQQPMFSD